MNFDASTAAEEKKTRLFHKRLPRISLLVFVNIVCIYGFALLVVHFIIPWCKQKLTLRRNCTIGFRERKKFAPRKIPPLLAHLREEERVKEKVPYFARRSLENLIMDLSSADSPKISQEVAVQCTGPETDLSTGLEAGQETGAETEVSPVLPVTPRSGLSTRTSSSHSSASLKLEGDSSSGEKGPDIELMSIPLRRPKSLQRLPKF